MPYNRLGETTIMELPINQIIHGDCLEVMGSIGAKSIDMILCDLPYGTTACSWDTIIPFEPLWCGRSISGLSKITARLS
jgi:DNA modification methylase